MEKIISFRLRTQFLSTISNKSNIVLTGGCFDLLHTGHIAFLEAAKKYGDTLIILLESDTAIKHMKGKNRPVQNQTLRAHALAELPFVDRIILLDGIITNEKYDELILAIKPAIIATTKGDTYRHHKERQAKLTKATVIDVIERLPEYSTTKKIEDIKHL